MWNLQKGWGFIRLGAHHCDQPLAILAKRSIMLLVQSLHIWKYMEVVGPGVLVPDFEGMLQLVAIVRDSGCQKRRRPRCQSSGKI